MPELLSSPWLALLTFLVGLLIGHRTALWRDRRKDFNAAAVPVLSFLLCELDNPSPYSKRPSAVELHLFETHQVFWRRNRFRKAWCRQQQERQTACASDEIGQAYYTDSAAIRCAIAECLNNSRLW